jgi:cyanophycin synthetase
MNSPLVHRPALLALNGVALGRALLRFRNPRRRKAGAALEQFHDRLWRSTADELGASFTPLTDHIAEIALNGVTTRINENVTAIDDPVTLDVLHDKPLVHRLLAAHGLPVPPHAEFSLKHINAALKFLYRYDRNCVVKPANGTGGGRGITTGIRTSSQLARAAAAAAVYADALLIEDQIPGNNYRLLYLDGQLLDAFIRRFPSVTGDGKSTVAQLLRRENDRRLAAAGAIAPVLLTSDLDMRRTLAGAGLTRRSVPASGQVVQLKTVINENSGSDNSTVTRALHPDIVAAGAKAASVVGARFVGIDIITADHSRPLHDTRGVIVEVNGTPNLYYHYHKRDGAFPAALYVLRRLLHAEPLPLRKTGTQLVVAT